jgi:DNA-binding LacI/PurR family transcriptional regulator
MLPRQTPMPPKPGPHPTFSIPRQQSLSALAAATLRKAMLEGTWKDFLPSERRLCDMLQVSRPTVRSALHLLAKEGLVEIHQGRRNRLLAPPRRPSREASRLVGLVTTEPVSHVTSVTYQGISAMRAHLAEHGFATEILVCPPGSTRTQQRKLEEFMRHNRVLCCVLLSVGRPIQAWFQQRGVPALVLGSCHATVTLPSLDVDYRSVCRHAAGVFLGKGHRRIALVVPDSGAAGDLASEQGFNEAFELHSRHEQIRATVVRHSGTAHGITSRLDALFRSASPPTGLLVAKPQHVFIVILYLLRRGFSVPDTVSLIARDYDHVFEIVGPPIAHYSLDDDAFSHRLSRLMLQMVSQGYLSAEPVLIFPKFVLGGTVKSKTGPDLSGASATPPRTPGHPLR